MRWGKLFVASNKRRVSLGISLFVIVIAAATIVIFNRFHAQEITAPSTDEVSHAFDVNVTLSKEQFQYLLDLDQDPTRFDLAKSKDVLATADKVVSTCTVPLWLTTAQTTQIPTATSDTTDSATATPVVSESPWRIVYYNPDGYKLDDILQKYLVPPILRPVPTPTPTPVPVEPIPTPNPIPCPPGTEPTPNPIPTPSPTPTPIPPQPSPTPTPSPSPSPAPVPTPSPAPAPSPIPAPNPSPSPSPSPEPSPTPDPGSPPSSSNGTCIDPNNKLNFSFDPAVPAVAKQVISDAITTYIPKIYSFYGPPPVKDNVLIRALDMPGEDGSYEDSPPTISLDKTLLKNASDPYSQKRLTQVLVHEIGHAWLGHFIMSYAVEEEGRASTLESHLHVDIWGDSIPDHFDYPPYDGSVNLKDFDPYFYTSGAHDAKAYFTGTHIYGKLWNTYKQFFPDFYCNLVARGNLHPGPSDFLAAVTAVFTRSGAPDRVEGATISNWLNAQFPLHPTFQAKPSYILSYQTGDIQLFDLKHTGTHIPFKATVKLADLRGNKLYTGLCESNSQNLDFLDIEKCPGWGNFSSPVAAKVTVTVTSPSEAAGKEFSAPWIITDEKGSYGTINTFILSGPTNFDIQPKQVTVTNLDTKQKITTTIFHGVIALDPLGVNLSPSGRLQFESLPCGTSTGTRYYIVSDPTSSKLLLYPRIINISRDSGLNC